MRRQKSKMKLYGGKCDVGGKASRFISRVTKTITLAILVILLELIMSFASSQDITEPTIAVPEETEIVTSDEPEFVIVPVKEIIKPEPEIIPDEEVIYPDEIPIEERGTYLGEFCITHYCTCSICNGSNAGRTAIGYEPVPWNTVAVDPNLIPLGSTLYIEGYGVVNALDTGSAVNGYHIDMMVNNHEEAIQHGVVYKEVYLL